LSKRLVLERWISCEFTAENKRVEENNDFIKRFKGLIVILKWLMVSVAGSVIREIKCGSERKK
jgi:hypothetical protein